MREGTRFRTSHLEVRASASPHVQPGAAVPLRVGIIVPKFSHSAVGRNLVKRRLRELVRHDVLHSGVAGKLVIRARHSAYDATFDMLSKDVHTLVQQLGGAGRLRP